MITKFLVIVVIIILSALSQAADADIDNICHTLPAEKQEVCKGTKMGALTCNDYSGEWRMACFYRAVNPNNGNLYNTAFHPVCNTLQGPLVMPCYNELYHGLIVCSDYPPPLSQLCEKGYLNPDNGKYYRVLSY